MHPLAILRVWRDLRGNPGGLLEEAVEIASYLLPKDVDIVSSRARNSNEEIVYKSIRDPIRPYLLSNKLPIPVAILVNANSASASEIVSGALQDYDAAVIIGPSRTYGKGLVQKIMPLPYDSALKFTVARYYTPSGRCIQSIKYNGGRGEDSDKVDTSIATDGRAEVADKDKKEFLTKHGRVVRDGGGIEPDILVPPIKIGPAENALVDSQFFFQFAGSYVEKHPNLLPKLNEQSQSLQQARKSDTRMLSGTEYLALDPAPKLEGLDTASSDLYTEFRQFVAEKIAKKEITNTGFAKELAALKTALASSGVSSAATVDVDKLQSKLDGQLLADLDKNKGFITEDLIFAVAQRAIPDRLLIQRTVAIDPQVQSAVDAIKDPIKYYQMLFKGPSLPQIRGTGNFVTKDGFFD